MSEALDDDPKPENVRMYVDAAVSKVTAVRELLCDPDRQVVQVWDLYDRW